jgi:hypothetical protein
MTNYTFRDVQEADSETGSQGVCIWLFHADKVPPHLGLSINGRYFSLLYNKLTCNVDMAKVLRTIKSKNIPTLVVEIVQQENTQVNNLEIANKIFCEFEELSKTHVTCLTPLKRTVGKIVNINLSECNVIFDVIDKCLDANVKLRFRHLFLGPSIDKNVFQMQHYSINEVKERIKKLRE